MSVKNNAAEFGWEETPYRPRRKKETPKKRGCPENDFGPHIYVWTTLATNSWSQFLEENDSFFGRHGFRRREYKVCCGCGKQQSSRYTEEMQKRITKLGWYEANYGKR